MKKFKVSRIELIKHEFIMEAKDRNFLKGMLDSRYDWKIREVKE